jgi:hypothetical protein
MLDNLTIHFEGFWRCRLSTDPDPTREGRGTSGYTVALPDEPDFDRVIETQLAPATPEHPTVKLREPFPPYLGMRDGKTRPFGVFVSSVEGAPSTQIAQLLEGAELWLMGRPQFELRNQIVGDGINRITPPIVPFDLQVSRGKQVLLRRADPLDPARPNAQIWELSPDEFRQRVPITYRHLSDEVVETIFPAGTNSANANAQFIAYFNQRKQWLTAKLSQANLDPVEAAGYRTRVRMIDSFTSPAGSSSPGLIEDRLGLQSIWEHPIRGRDPIVADSLRRHVDLKRDWRTRFWMGGWDGDLLIGWMVGRLELPLKPKR